MSTRLLLTSNGLTNAAIDAALVDLLGKPTSQSSAVFVITASNTMTGDKSWLIDDLRNAKRQRFSSLDVIDIAALEPSDTRRRFESADVVIFGGGDAYYLLDILELKQLRADAIAIGAQRVFVGISAGGIIAGPDLDMSSHGSRWGLKANHPAARPGLALTDIRVRPHLDSPNFPDIIESRIGPIADEIGGVTYALDDQTALKITDTEVVPVGRGKWIKFAK